MKSIKRLTARPAPGIKKKVVELEVGGRLGKWFTNHNWAAVTIPFPFFVLIMYWSAEDAPDGNVEALTRVHEWTHVAQDQLDRFFFVSWAKYLWWLVSGVAWKKVLTGKVGLVEAFMQSYYSVPYEVEAYNVEIMAEKNGLPDWVKL